jgi:outer membrane protein OmpA-like peptidoglycan-associated protein
MSDNRDKPADFDPDATVMQPRGRPDAAADSDPDATVMMSRKALSEPDADATVMMRASDMAAPPDEDATVMMKAGLGVEPTAEAKPERKPLAAFQSEADPDATVIGAPPPPEPEPAPVTAAPAPQAPVSAPAAAIAPELATPVTADTSRMPLIAGGIVVVAVALYFMFAGGKPPAKPEAAPVPAAASTTPSTPAAPAPAAAAAPAAPAPAAPAAPAPAAPVPAVAAAKGTDLKSLLAAEAKRGSIAIAEEGGATSITLRSTNQFASGGVDLDPRLQPVIAAIAAALDKAPGAIVVTGHADAKPSSNPKYPSNQELSTARGASVAKLLAGKLRDPKRVSSTGASDAQQVAPSDTPENRAKNRRVVIVLRPAS